MTRPSHSADRASDDWGGRSGADDRAALDADRWPAHHLSPGRTHLVDDPLPAPR